MRFPRDMRSEDLIRMLERLGYRNTRQTGSHIRMTVASEEGEFHLTVPRHKTLKSGTLHGILSDVARHLNKSKEELLRYL